MLGVDDKENVFPSLTDSSVNTAATTATAAPATKQSTLVSTLSLSCITLH